MEEDFIALLLANGGLSALVGTRIKWARIHPAPVLPYVIMTVVSAPRDYQMGGATGLVESRVQIDCWGSTYISAKSVARAVESALSGFSGTRGSTKFDGVFQVGERDLVDDDDTPADLFGVSLDFMVWHKET